MRFFLTDWKVYPTDEENINKRKIIFKKSSIFFLNIRTLNIEATNPNVFLQSPPKTTS